MSPSSLPPRQASRGHVLRHVPEHCSSKKCSEPGCHQVLQHLQQHPQWEKHLAAYIAAVDKSAALDDGGAAIRKALAPHTIRAVRRCINPLCKMYLQLVHRDGSAGLCILLVL